jgi:hypothetical protein
MGRHINRYWFTGLTALLWIAAVSGLSADSTASASQNFPFAAERLRNPFWPVDYQPDSWAKIEDGARSQPADDSNWDGPAAQLRVSGTSQMGSRLVAIVNDEIKSIGELVEVHYSGSVYQWKVQDIQADGTVNLERYAVKTEPAGFQPKSIK